MAYSRSRRRKTIKRKSVKKKRSVKKRRKRSVKKRRKRSVKKRRKRSVKKRRKRSVKKRRKSFIKKKKSVAISQNLINWERNNRLDKIPITTGLEADGHIFKTIIKPMKATIQKRQYVDIKHKNMTYRIHLEHIHIGNMINQSTGENWWMVNQELVQKNDLKMLQYINLVITKTKYATKLIRQLQKTEDYGYDVFYLGFTSLRKVATGPMNYNKMVHIAGASWMKSTGVILKAWINNPHYPHLTVLCRNRCKTDFIKQITMIKEVCKHCSNITIHTDLIPFKDLRVLQTQSGVHLVPSQTEGWGHYIQEAKALGALCIYSDFPPMNESFRDGYDGVAVKGYILKKTEFLPGAYGIDFTAKQIEQAVNKVLKMPLSKRKQIGLNAQKSFYSDRRKFLNNAKKLKNLIIKRH